MRPAVLVQADFLNCLIDDTILVQVTGTRHGIPGTEVVIDPVNEPGSGLLKVSFDSCANLLTRDQALVDQTLGYLSDALMRQIETCVKTVLELT